MDLSVGDRVKIADNALTFTCGMDGDYSNHTYPRSTDPASGQYIEITSATTDSITVNVGASPAVLSLLLLELMMLPLVC